MSREDFVTVTFEESECVTTAGTETSTYLVLYERVWMPPQKLPLAKTEFLKSGPSVLWRRYVTAALPIGTKVERVLTRPERGKASTADLLLGKAAGLRRHTRRLAFTVGPKGVLKPV